MLFSNVCLRSSYVSLGLAACIAPILGCGGKELPPAPQSNRDVVSAAGEFVGHLKPNAHMPTSDVYPVIWVVRDGEAIRRDDNILLGGFRLDWDELQPISSQDFPYALMTENTKEIVVHRGDPGTHVFTHPDVNDGERCLTMHQCANPECPKLQELQDFGLFGHDPAAGEAVCPYCNSSESTLIYVVPQKAAMERFLNRKG